MHAYPINYWLSIPRIIFGFIVPVLLFPNYYEPTPLNFMIFIGIGELMDRIEFYLEADIITPKKQIELDLLQKLENITS